MSAVRGWCPTAHAPMAAGDGLLLRVRPRLGRLTRAQVAVLCDTARTHGNGWIDLTSRAALQLRGLTGDGWRAAVARLTEAGLVDPDPVREARGALIVAPDWRSGDDTHRIAIELLARLDELPALPAKAGFVVDAGARAVLLDDPGDFRLERAEDGRLLLRADGSERGVAMPPGGEADALIALARWFVESGGGEAGRMARHALPLPGWASGTLRPARAPSRPSPGPHPLGRAIAVPFGRIAADRLDAIATGAMRVTPWRIAIFEGVTANVTEEEETALPAVDACVGAPECPQATVATRDLALRLARHVACSLHVSGCAKGCARARPAAVTLTGRDGRFDLAFDARAGAAPAAAGLDPAQVLARFGAA